MIEFFPLNGKINSNSAMKGKISPRKLNLPARSGNSNSLERGKQKAFISYASSKGGGGRGDGGNGNEKGEKFPAIWEWREVYRVDLEGHQHLIRVK